MSQFTPSKTSKKLALIAAGLLVLSPMAAQAQSMEEAFAAADANGDGALDVAEYQAFIDTLATAGDENAATVKEGGYSDAFTGADADQSGALSPAELGLS